MHRRSNRGTGKGRMGEGEHQSDWYVQTSSHDNDHLIKPLSQASLTNAKPPWHGAARPESLCARRSFGQTRARRIRWLTMNTSFRLWASKSPPAFGRKARRVPLLFVICASYRDSNWRVCSHCINQQHWSSSVNLLLCHQTALDD